jgi:lipopolysaccharide biosynthesis glycosyltransferase
MNDKAIHSEFLELFDKLEGTNIQKLRTIAQMLNVEINTVRIWKSNARKQIPIQKLALLKLMIK